MWELDHKEGWVPKNWCFWIVVLEKTLENPSDSKEIKLVNSKGNQVLNTHWKDWRWGWNSSSLATRFEEPIHWKRLWCWENWEQERRGQQRVSGLDGITDPMDVSLSELRDSEGQKEPGMLQFTGSQRVGLSNWTTTNYTMELVMLKLKIEVRKLKVWGLNKWILKINEKTLRRPWLKREAKMVE